MAYVPFTPEFGAPMTLTGPDGTVAAFNDPTNPNFCGYLSDLTGLDSADVREVGDVLASADGGWHGNFWYGRRPITISGTLPNITSAADRAAKLDLLRRASNAMRGDAVLAWTNTAVGAVPMQTWVRRQQPLRITGGWVKSFNLSLVSQFAPLFSQTQHAPTGTTSISAENQGDYPSYPIIRINGPTTNPVVTNTTTGTVLKFLTGFLPAPTGLNVSINPAIGTWSPVVPEYYMVTAVNASGETSAASEVSITPTFARKINVNWQPVVGATSYRVYRSTSSFGEGVSPARVATVTAPTTYYLDSGSAVTAGAVPTTNTAASSFSLASGHFVDIDTLNHTATQDGTTNMNNQIDFLGTIWPALVKGVNAFTLSGGGTFQLTYRDCWT